MKKIMGKYDESFLNQDLSSKVRVGMHPITPSEARKKGWEQESNQSKGANDSSPTSTENAKAPAAEKKTKAEPATTPAKKPIPKNPYSGGKSKKAKGPK